MEEQFHRLLPQPDDLKLMAGAWNGKASLIDQTRSGLGKVDDHLLDWFEGGAAIESNSVIEEPEKQFFLGLGLGLDVENPSKKMRESARIGSRDSSDGSSLVKAIGLPNSQVA